MEQEVNNSMLCLLENPAESISYIHEFVAAYDPKLVDRVRFQRKLLELRFIGVRCLSVCFV
jgi:hypothetical protein